MDATTASVTRGFGDNILLAETLAKLDNNYNTYPSK